MNYATALFLKSENLLVASEPQNRKNTLTFCNASRLKQAEEDF